MADADTEPYSSPGSGWLLDRRTPATPPPPGPAMIVPPPGAGYPPALPPSARHGLPVPPTMPRAVPVVPLQRASRQADTLALLSAIVGGISVLFMPLFICSMPIAITGVMLGAIGMGSPRRRRLAILGLVLSLIGLLGSGALTAMAVGLSLLL